MKCLGRSIKSLIITELLWDQRLNFDLAIFRLCNNLSSFFVLEPMILLNSSSLTVFLRNKEIAVLCHSENSDPPPFYVYVTILSMFLSQ